MTTTTNKTTKTVRIVRGTIQSGDKYLGSVSGKWREVTPEMVGREISGVGVLRTVER